MSQPAKTLIDHATTEVKQELGAISEELLAHKNIVGDEIRSIRKEMETLKREIKKRPLMLGKLGSHVPSPSIKVAKPDVYIGNRNATTVENFLFGLEQYFDASGVVDDAAKIRNILAFLREYAQLWWRRKYTEREKGTYNINTWEQFKIKLRKHFVPYNATE